MPSYDTRLAALDRALNGYAGELDPDEILTAARAFEAYLTGESPAPSEAPAEEPRPFQVGDRVFVSKGAGWRNSRGAESRSVINAPCEAVIKHQHHSLDEDPGNFELHVPGERSSYSVHSSYLTLKEGPQ